MFRSSKSRASVLWNILGVTFIVLGVTAIIYKPFTRIARNIVNKEMRLMEDTVAFNHWRGKTLKFIFRVYIFNVTNPDEILKGKTPLLVEHGPYVYDYFIQREILETDKVKDEIKFVLRKRYSFNREKSTNVSEDDDLTVLNIAYMGTINTLATLPRTFMDQFGNLVPKLFPNPKSIFIKGKAKNILFDGLRLTCNAKRYPNLTTICVFLQNSRPPIVIETAKEGVYLFSMFNHINNSAEGPFIINRGTKDLNRLGDITSFRNRRVQEIWGTEECNVVSGKESLTFSPTQEHVSRISIFSSEVCQKIFSYYSNEVVIRGLKAKRYKLSEQSYDDNECYCPEVKKKIDCYPKGLIDLTKCQNGPILYSEPHFLHADNDLLHYVRGLHPDEERHFTDIVIHEMTGMPVTGHKRAQFVIKVSQQPVDLLANVSESYFPLMWTEETSSIDAITFAYQTQRLMFLLQFLHLIPVIIGSYIILATMFLHGGQARKTLTVNPTAQSVLTSHQSCVN